MVCDVIGAAHEFVECEDQGAVARRNEPRRYRKILVSVGLVGPEFRSIRHHTPFTFTTLRPLHWAAALARVLIGGVKGKCHVGRRAIRHHLAKMFRESAWKAYLLPRQYRVMSLLKKRPFHGGELQLANQRVTTISFGLRTAMTVGLLLSGCGVLHAAQDVQETYAQRQACKPDVWRLCSAFIPRR